MANPTTMPTAMMKDHAIDKDIVLVSVPVVGVGAAVPHERQLRKAHPVNVTPWTSWGVPAS